MQHWKEILKRINTWQQTRRLQGTSMEEDEAIFFKELSKEYVLLKLEKADMISMHEIAEEYHKWLELNVDRLAEEELDFREWSKDIKVNKKDMN